MNLLIDLGNKSEPAWSTRVDRWYQLDEVSFSFCEALYQWNYLSDLQKPDLILLALPGASNLSDFDFVNTGAISPAKFVYTLPNICISVIFQMLGYSGKVYCFHQGDKTVEFAENEARETAKSGKDVWVFASSPILENSQRRVQFQRFSNETL